MNSKNNVSNKILHIFSTPIGDNTPQIPIQYHVLLTKCEHYFVENKKIIRRFLSSIKIKHQLDPQFMTELNQKQGASSQEINTIFSKYKNIALMSDAGLPCLADPGNKIVMKAHKMGFRIKVNCSDSAIIKALIGSGFNGQRFTFNGYCPIGQQDRGKYIKQLIDKVNKTGYTQLFMETPYRTNNVFKDLLKNMPEQMYLSISADLDGENEMVQTMTIANWKKSGFIFKKEPAVFALGRE